MTQRHDAHAFATGDARRALRKTRDVRDDVTDALFDLRCDKGIVRRQPLTDGGKIAALPEYRRPSCATKFGEGPLHFFIRGEPALLGVVQATVDARELFRRRMVEAVLEAGIDIERDIGQLLLPFRRLSLDAFERLRETLGFHERNIGYSRAAAKCVGMSIASLIIRAMDDQ